MKEDSEVPQEQKCPKSSSKAFPAGGLIEISALLKDRNFIPFLAFIKEKTKVGEELQQVTELVLFLFSPLGSILVHNYHSI